MRYIFIIAAIGFGAVFVLVAVEVVFTSDKLFFYAHRKILDKFCDRRYNPLITPLEGR